MSDNKATWIVELNTECPNCKEWVDLVDYGFLENNPEIEISYEAKNIRVICPKCGHKFTVDLEY